MQRLTDFTIIRRGMDAARVAGAAVAFFAFPALTVPVYAQPGPASFSCQSMDGQRTSCRADMSRGDVQLTRQLGDVRCVEGYTWGREPDGVWVDRGCRAEFLLPPEPRRPVEKFTRIESGTIIPVRTNERITSERADGRIFTGTVDQDVVGTNGHLAIPRGSNVEMVVRVAHDQDLILDLDSVMINGQRYAVDAAPDRVDAPGGTSAGRTGKFVGGQGAALGRHHRCNCRRR